MGCRAAIATFQSAAVAARGPRRLQRPRVVRQPSCPRRRRRTARCSTRYCFSCHNQRLKTAGLALDTLDLSNIAANSDVWEKVVWKLRGGIMPPVNRPRPDRDSVDAFASCLEGELDRAAAANPNPGRVPVHRLNRAEYTNAVRDLLDVRVEPLAAAGRRSRPRLRQYRREPDAVSPALLERYMAAARRISRLAIGDPTIGPGYTSTVYSVPMNMTQNDRMSEDLPFGSRGGLAAATSFRSTVSTTSESA